MLTGQYSYKECQLALYRTLIFSDGIDGILTRAMRKACPGIHNLACAPVNSHSHLLILRLSAKTGKSNQAAPVSLEDIDFLDELSSGQ